MKIARPIAELVSDAVGGPIVGAVGEFSVQDSAATFELSGTTRQIVIDALEGEVVGRWITPTQVEAVGNYLYDWRLPVNTGRSVLSVPADATAFSMMRGPDETGSVPFTFTEAVQAAPTLRGGDLSTDINTLTTTSAAVAAYQGSVTPAANVGRILNGWHSKNVSPNAGDMASMTEGGTALISAGTTSVEGIDAWIITLMNDADANQISEVWSSGWTDTSQGVLVVGVRAVDASGVGKITRLFAQGATLTAGSSVTSIECTLTEAWQYYYLNKTFASGDTGGMEWGFVHTTAGNTDAATFYVAEAMLEDVTGLTTILPSPYQGDSVDHWSEFHPTRSAVSNPGGGYTVVAGGTSEAGLVFSSPVRRAIGAIDIFRTAHKAGTPNIGARA